jgi:hypothetical protein
MINKAKDAYHDTGMGAIMWGAVIAFCSLVRLAEIQFGFRLPFDIYLLTVVAVIPQIYISIKEKKARKVKAYDDAFLDYLWFGFGISIFLLILIVNIIARDLLPVTEEYNVLKQIPSSFRLYEYIAPLFLMLYGLPTFVTGAAFKFRPMFWGGIFCWTCCAATLFTPIRVDLLLTAASAVFAWLIPGIIMEREYRRYKKQSGPMHV